MDHFKVALLIPVTAAAASTIWCYGKTNDLAGDAMILAGSVYNHPAFIFGLLFVWRYLRVFVHLIAGWILYKPSPIADKPRQTPRDCTVIIPTGEPPNPDFHQCLESCLKNGPAEIIVVTFGEQMAVEYSQVLGPYQFAWPNTIIRSIRSPVASRQVQIASAISHVRTRMTVLHDARTFWTSANFLPAALAPFENKRIASVGTIEHIRRADRGLKEMSFWTMLNAVDLERHSLDLRATNTIDGGVSAISGRTSLHRSQVLQDPDFINSYVSQRFANDGHFIANWVFRRDWDVKIQICEDTRTETITTSLPSSIGQRAHRMRKSWRNKTSNLFASQTPWWRHLWSAYAVSLTWFTDFALFYDLLLISMLPVAFLGGFPAVVMLQHWINLCRVIELLPYISRHPIEICMLPGYLSFMYLDNFIKLWAGVTSYRVKLEQNYALVNDTHLVTPKKNGVRKTYMTPWGKTAPPTQQTTPANVLQKQYTSHVAPQKNGTKIGRVTIVNPISTIEITPIDSPLGSIDPYQPCEHPVDWQKIVPAPFTPPTSPLPQVETGDRPVEYLPTPPTTIETVRRINTVTSSTSSSSSSSSSLSSAISFPDTSTDPQPTPHLDAVAKPVYKRQWVRGPQCARLHYDGCKLARNGGCRVQSIWTLPQHVLQGKPRF